MRQVIHDIVSSIKPYDALERTHIDETLSWIQSSEVLFRLQKPAIPPKHLVSYFVLFDETVRKILLVDHKMAQRWLPTGGHVEVDEHPKETVVRESFEELKIQADFWQNDPFFLTTTVTTGLAPGHTDVSLWYILRGDHQHSYLYDTAEFNTIQWFGFDDIPYHCTDPHMERFIAKLRETLNDFPQ